MVSVVELLRTEQTQTQIEEHGFNTLNVFHFEYFYTYDHPHLDRGFPNVLALHPQNNCAGDWGPPSTLEGANNTIRPMQRPALIQHKRTTA